ncbi:ABC transporter substrate-binding protein [Leucobacter sp. GX24907]
MQDPLASDPDPVRTVAALHGASVTRGGTLIVSDLSLELFEGDLLTVVGPSGAGKSTLLGLLAGLWPASAGEVRRPEDAGGSTRLVFQEPRLLPWRTAAENVRLGLEYRANGGRGLGHAHDADARVAALLGELGIGDLADRLPEELSGGQAQRVAVARAVAADPTLLLLDEPFSGLDPVSRTEAQEWLRRVHRRLGLSTVLVTHDLSEAARLGDRVAVLRPGGASLEVFESPDGDHARLESGLLRAFPGVVEPPTATARPSRRPSRREVLTVAAAGALIALPAIGSFLTGASSAASSRSAGGSDDHDVLRLGYLPITDAAPLLIAHDSGAFADRGIDTPEPTLFRSWASLVEALQGGSIDVAHLLMPLAMQLRYEAEMPIKVLAWNHVGGSALAVLPEIDSIEGLAGTTVAIPGWFSIHNVVLQQLLREAGLTAVIDTDPGPDTVQLVVLAPADMPVALGNGTVSGYIVAEPFCAVAEKQGVGRILRFTGDVWREHACCVTVVREDLVTDNPELAQRVADAVVAGQLAILADRAAAAERLSVGGYLPQPPESIAAVLDEHESQHAEYVDDGAIHHPEWEESRIGFQPYAYPGYTERLVEELRLTTVDATTAWLDKLDPAAVHADLVSTDINLRAVESAGGLAVFGATPTRTEVIEP